MQDTYPHEIKVIVSDIDHTFSDKYNKDGTVHVSKLNYDMVKWVQEQGIIFTFATGRHKSSTYKLKDLPEPSTYILCNNGGMVYDIINDEVIVDNHIPKEEVIKVFDFAKANSLRLYIGATDKIHYHNFHGLNRYPSQYLPLDTYTEDPYELIETREVQKLVFIDEHEVLQELHHGLVSSKILNEESSYVVFSALRSLEVHPAAAQKGNGIEYLSKHLNVPLENFMVFGDAMNDYSMFEKAGVKVVMSAAMPELKKFPHAYQASNSDNNAVGQFLRMWFHKIHK